MTDKDKAIQESERIAAADEYFKARTWIMDTSDNRRIFEAGFDRAYALLSKLRAPVADEPPLGAIINGRTLAERLEAYPFESEGGDLRLCSDWVEFRRCFEYLAELASALVADPKPTIVNLPAYTNDDSQPLQYRLGWNNCLSDCRAALASAPEQPQGCPTDVCQAGKADGVLCANDECDRSNGVRPPMCRIPGVREDVLRRAAERMASAPVAGGALTAEDVERQYRDGMHIGSGLPRATCPCGFCSKHRHGFERGDDLVAPQASEAVRIMFWDAKFPTEIHETLDDAMYTAQGNHGLLQGDTVEIQQAVRLPALRILVTDGDDEGDNFKYEVAGDSHEPT